MTGLTRRLLPLAGDRPACAVRFFFLAALLSAANILLGAVATAVFLVDRGPGELPLFYMVLAAVSIPLASALGTVIDRWARLRIFQGLMLATAAVAGLLWLLMPLGLAAVSYAVYLASHALDIAGWLVFWVLASEYFTTLDLKRITVALSTGIALGGALGGAGAALLYDALGPTHLLLVLPLLLLAVVALLASLGHGFEPVAAPPDAAEAGPDDEPGLVESLAGLPMLMLRYRLVLLMALGLMLMTVLYCLQEYLVFTVYAAAFPDPNDLGRFLAILYAALQLVEFALLCLASGPLIARTGPVLRSAIFPATTLATLGWFALAPSLPAAVLCHGNVEAGSNALFEPVRHVNHMALPLRILGRARTVADGMIYPASIALAGLLLLVMQAHLTLEAITVVTLAGGVAFLAVQAAVGRSFLPTLARSLRAGAISIADVTQSVRALPASFAGEVRRLLDSGDADARAVGLVLALRLAPGGLLDRIPGLAPGADPATRRGLAAMLVRAPRAAAGAIVDRLLGSDDPAGQTLALQVALARALPLDDGRLARLGGSGAPVPATLARLAAGNEVAPAGATERDAEAVETLIETVALGAGGAVVECVIALVRDGPTPVRRTGLAALAALAGAPSRAVGAVADALVGDADPGVRAGALRLLGELPATPGRLDHARAGLADRDRRVRRAAADALARHGGQAVDLLGDVPAAAPEALWHASVRCLGQIPGRRARDLLHALLAPTLGHAAANAALMRQRPGSRDRGLWEPLDVALDDSNRRVVERVLAALAALRRDRLVARLRHGLASADLRTRANAVEGLASLPERGLIAAALPLVEAISVGLAPGAGDAAAALDAAAASWDPWVVAGGAMVRAALAGDPGGARGHGDAEDADMDLLLFLKRTRLFGPLPLDTLLALGRVLVAESYVAGEMVFADGSPAGGLYVVRSGAVNVVRGGHLLARLGPGAAVGEMALIDDAPRSADVVAAGDCTLLRLDRATFHDLTEDYPAMLRELCRVLAANLRETSRRLAEDASPLP